MNRLRKAFTLIELLVVVAIISLLMAILLPALGRARDQARTSTCLSNLKQLGVAFTIYASEYDGFMLPATTLMDPSNLRSDTYGWPAILLDTQITARSGSETIGAWDLSAKSASGKSTFRCPSGLNTPYGAPWTDPQSQNDPRNAYYTFYDLKNGRTDSTKQQVLVWYAVNSLNYYTDSSRIAWCPMRHLPSSDDQTNFQTLKLSNIVSPGDAVLLYDGFQYGSSAMPLRIHARHNQNSVTNIALLDGHAESFKTANLPQAANATDIYVPDLARKQSPRWRIDLIND